VARRKIDALAAHCRAEGRDIAEIRKTWSGPVIIERDHQAALRRAGDRLEREKPPIAGDPSAVTERIQELAELGFDLFQVSFEQFPETTDLELFVSDVMPRF
jgi:alkanesulfonate monooxygenase SsuD/methylene tetrahydromethanopterin reductase-like flavin-dependent oxidoreductase (luciferase family)